MDIEHQVKELVGRMTFLPVDEVHLHQRLHELLLDSFAVVDLSIAVQDEFDILFHQDDLLDLHTVGDLIRLVRSKCSN